MSGRWDDTPIRTLFMRLSYGISPWIRRRITWLGVSVGILRQRLSGRLSGTNKRSAG